MLDLISAAVSPFGHSLIIHAVLALAIDVTGRNWQEELKKKGLPWAPAKGFDTWSAVGYVGVRPHHLSSCLLPS